MIQNPQIGDTVYFVENNYRIIEAVIKSHDNSFCLLCYQGNKCIRLRHSRLYKSKIEAENAIIPDKNIKIKNPYDYEH